MKARELERTARARTAEEHAEKMERLREAVTVAERILAAREAAGLSQREASRRTRRASVGRGVSHTMIQRYEAGDMVPGTEVAAALAHVYGVPVSYLSPDG